MNIIRAVEIFRPDVEFAEKELITFDQLRVLRLIKMQIVEANGADRLTTDK